MALLILVIISFHEQGHVWAMNRLNIPNKGFYLTPLGGAAIPLEDPKTETESLIMFIMGPLWGCFQSLFFWTLYLILNYDFFMYAAGFSAMINLFNLLPIYPLDGGQIVLSLAESCRAKSGLWVLIGSLIGSIFLFIWLKHIVMFIIILYTILNLYQVIKRDQIRPAPMDFKGVLLGITAYVSLIIALLLTVVSAFGLQVMNKY